MPEKHLISFFEPLVIKSITLFKVDALFRRSSVAITYDQVSRRVTLQVSVLSLLCAIVRIGVDYQSLDKNMTLLTHIVQQLSGTKPVVSILCALMTGPAVAIDHRVSKPNVLVPAMLEFLCVLVFERHFRSESLSVRRVMALAIDMVLIHNDVCAIFSLNLLRSCTPPSTQHPH